MEEGKEKENQGIDHHKNHHHGTKLVLGIVGLIVIAGGALAVAKVINHKSGFANRGGLYQGGMMGKREFGNRGGMMQAGGRRLNRRGTSGDVIKIDGNNITIDNGTQDISITVTSDSSYRKNGQIAKQSDMVVGNNISVIGSSDSNGVVKATMIIIK